MARKNNNAGQPNRVAQINRRKRRGEAARGHKSAGIVLGPLSEHLIRTEKATGELVESTRFMVGAA